MSSPILGLADGGDLLGCVLAYGHFSTIHAGHIRYLRHAAEQGQRLVVALIGDGPADQPAPYPFSQQERAEALSLLGIADALVLLQANELPEAIAVLRPAELVLGTEYRDNPTVLASVKALRELGGAVQFHAGGSQYAGVDLLNSSERVLRQQRRRLFQATCHRQGLDQEQLIETIEALATSRLAVLGDTIVDQYTACEAIGMSAEAPVVVVRELDRRHFIGGAAVVAAHIRALGARCDLVSVVGVDPAADLVREELKSQEIGNALTADPSRPTTFKKRYVVDNQKLFRVSRVEDHNLATEIEDQVIQQLERLAPLVDGVVVSDFVYGVVTPRILQRLQQLAQDHKLLLFGDLQCSSQVGSVTRFQGFSLLCPNEREARLALQDKDSGLEQLSQQLLHTTGSERLLMKLGAEGFIAYDRNSAGQTVNQPFPALSVNPLDVTGAGDSMLAVMATGLASGQSMMATAALACCMASIAVETMGNTPISRAALKTSVEEVLQP